MLHRNARGALPFENSRKSQNRKIENCHTRRTRSVCAIGWLEQFAGTPIEASTNRTYGFNRQVVKARAAGTTTGTTVGLLRLA